MVCLLFLFQTSRSIAAVYGMDECILNSIMEENNLAVTDVLHSIPSTPIEAESGFRNLGEIRNNWRNMTEKYAIIFTVSGNK